MLSLAVVMLCLLSTTAVAQYELSQDQVDHYEFSPAEAEYGLSQDQVDHYESVPDEVYMNEGYSTPEAAARAGAEEAWQRAEATTMRPDGAGEVEFGGMVYQTPDGRYGYTTPRTDAGKPIEGDVGNPATFNRPHRGTLTLNSNDEEVLLTPNAERAVASYHTHPERPIGGDDVLTAGPSGRDGEWARDWRLDAYVLGVDGFGVVHPDGTIESVSLDPSQYEGVEVTRRPFVCKEDPICDRGHDAECRAVGGRVSCKPLRQGCLRLDHLPDEAFREEGGECGRALRNLRDARAGEDSQRTISARQPAGGFGGLGIMIEKTTKTLADAILAISLHVERHCPGLGAPICPESEGD